MIVPFGKFNSKDSNTNWSQIQSQKFALASYIFCMISEICVSYSLFVIVFILHSCLVFLVIVCTFLFRDNLSYQSRMIFKRENDRAECLQNLLVSTWGATNILLTEMCWPEAIPLCRTPPCLKFWWPNKIGPQPFGVPGSISEAVARSESQHWWHKKALDIIPFFQTWSN